jgi:soluble lytic murein transglycosylase
MVYALIRQESRFNVEIKSRVGATGLMQLMPATARWVAKQIPVNNYRPALLTDPPTNVAMGTYYFRRVLTDLGDPILATAGYNAGPGRARRWQDAKPLEGAIYAESIPFNETRDYVKKVMANAWFYRHRLTGQPASLRQLMGTVPGRSGANADAVAALP